MLRYPLTHEPVIRNIPPMRIGLISDTHIPDVAPELPPEINEAFRGVDLILHAGDIYIPSVLDDLERIAPVLAAKGDDDPLDMLDDKRVKSKHVMKLGSYTLWLIHERPYTLVSQPKGEGVPDIVVFGHEHLTTVQRYRDILFVNPGSPTFLNYRRGLGTVGILNINSTEAEASILQL